MAGAASRLLERIPAAASRIGGAESGAATAPGWATAAGESCQEQLGFRPEINSFRSVVRGSGRRGSCKEQLGFGQGLHLSASRTVTQAGCGSCKEHSYGAARARVL